MDIRKIVMDNRKILRTLGNMTFSTVLFLYSFSCFSQNLTTRAAENIGMTNNYDFYVFFLNNEIRISYAMSFTNDTIHICPYIVHNQSDGLFNAVIIKRAPSLQEGISAEYVFLV